MRAIADDLADSDGADPTVRAALVAEGDAARLAGAQGIALVLHGGQETSVDPAAARQLAVLRMIPIARHLASAVRPTAIAVWRLRFRYRGWNKDAAHPIVDVRWALRQLRERHGDVPIVLVGHSMGGRAAIRAANAPGVAGVLGLAPWVPPGEPYEQLAGRRLLVLHGARDRVTSAQASKALVDAVREDAAEATFISVRHGGHAMLRRAALWNDLTTDFVLHASLGVQRERLDRAIAAGDSAL